ncbi:MAG: hypothetical protein QW068_02545, partial [Thermoplasmata archaeon]
MNQTVHSEGIGIFSVWPPVIVGIDFEKEKFIYSQDLTKEILDVGFLKIKLNSFFPYMTFVIFGKEITISWVFYYTPFIPYLLSRPIKDSDKLMYLIAVPIVIMILAYIISCLSLATKIFQNFIDKKNPKIIFLLFLISSSSFYCLLLQFHHLQSAIFFNIFLSSLIMMNYTVAIIAGGLAIYSYAPSIYLVVGAYITKFMTTREKRRILFCMLLSFLFLAPYVWHIKLSEKINYSDMLGCNDCIFYNAYTELYNFFGQKVEGFSLDKIIPKIFQGLSQTLSSCCFVKEAFVKLKSSFSLSDIYLGYGFISQKSDLHFISDTANTIVLAITLIFGIIFFTKSFEVIFIIVSLFLFLSLGVIIPAVPKML